MWQNVSLNEMYIIYEINVSEMNLSVSFLLRFHYFIKPVYSSRNTYFGQNQFQFLFLVALDDKLLQITG